MSLDNLDDVPIIDVRPMDTEHTVLAGNNLLNTSLSDDSVRTPRENVRRPAISSFRPSNILRSLILLQFLSVVIIWFISGRTHALLDDIAHFHFATSIFDLVVLTTLKLISATILVTELEARAITRLYQPIAARLSGLGDKEFVIALTLLGFGTSTFSIIKLVAVLRSLSLSRLNLSAVCIFLALSVLEIGVLPWAYVYIKRLKLIEQRPVDSREKEISLRRVLSLARSERSWLLMGTLFLLIAHTIDAIDLFLFGKIVGFAFEQESMHPVNVVIGIVLGLDLVSSIAAFLRTWIFALAGQKMVRRLRQNVFDAIVKQDISFFDENRTGELTSRLSSDTQVVQDSITENLAALAQYSIHIVGSLIVMFCLNYALTIVLMVVVPMVVLIALKYGNVVEGLRKKFQDRLAEASNVADESFSNIRTVRIFGAESKVRKNYSGSLSQSFAIGKKLAFNDALFTGVLGLLVSAAVSAVLWYGAKLVHEKKLTIGVLASFLLYMLQVAIAFASLAELYTGFMQAMGASKRLFGLIDRQPAIPSTADTSCSIRPRDFDGTVHFDRVCFSYPTRSDEQVLSDLSFSIAPGQKVALVGPSGAGKSTIALLIERFYDPQSGRIFFGSDTLSTVDPQWIRENVAFVNQEPSLFACSVRDNIAFGLDPAHFSFEGIVRAAKQANAHQFIEEFEHKYDTLVGERGVCLSGGQKQPLAIARALLTNPKLLLLDEATSALDAESEYLVTEAVQRAMVNRSVLIIAHRLSTVRDADAVIVLDRGKIVQQGTHHSLLNKDDGLYKHLLLKQLMPSVST